LFNNFIFPCSNDIMNLVVWRLIQSTYSHPIFLNRHFNIILPPQHRSSMWSLAYRHSYHNPICIFLLAHTCHVPHPFHPPLFNYPNNIWVGVQIMKLLIIQASPVSCSFPCSGPNLHLPEVLSSLKYYLFTVPVSS
jgi:hypothetical protein